MIYFLFVLTLTMIERVAPSQRSDAKFEDYPYVVRIERLVKTGPTEYILTGWTTGSLVTPEWVLTCAHCINEYKVKEVRIRYGDMTESWYKSANYSNAIKFEIYPTYKSFTTSQMIEYNENDIALIKIDMAPIGVMARLSGIEYTSLGNLRVIMATYGVVLKQNDEEIQSEEFQKPLQVGKGALIPCQPDLVRFRPSLCVAPKCEDKTLVLRYGDGGGALVYNYDLIGVAVGEAASDTNETLVHMLEFTPISPYLDWIEDIILNENFSANVVE